MRRNPGPGALQLCKALSRELFNQRRALAGGIWRGRMVAGALASSGVIDGYASVVLQNRSDLNRVRQKWVMMFR
jgi:hypothetical protein